MKTRAPRMIPHQQGRIFLAELFGEMKRKTTQNIQDDET